MVFWGYEGLVMRFSATNILNGVGVAGAIAMMVFGAYQANEFTAGRDGIDRLTTASVNVHAKTQIAALADQFTVISHRDNRSCVLKLHRAIGYDVHRIEPSQNCDTVRQEFSLARAWQENAAGTVTIADRTGKRLMKLARGDGFAWDVIEPANMNISLDAF
ncbi:MAG: hypothetical protein U5K75_01745 [Ahrensia sp.]|nr:hypothetical protein [Ahrensia sp.]